MQNVDGGIYTVKLCSRVFHGTGKKVKWVIKLIMWDYHWDL